MAKHTSILSFKEKILIPFNAPILKNLGKFLIIELIFRQRKFVKNDVGLAKKYKFIIINCYVLLVCNRGFTTVKQEFKIKGRNVIDNLNNSQWRYNVYYFVYY